MMNGPMLGFNGSTTASFNGNDDDDSKTYTLYLLRHGEAEHNIQEKAAVKRALEASLTHGLNADSAEARGRIEKARQAVLEDKSFFDAPLSEKGMRESAAARKLIQELTCPVVPVAQPPSKQCCWLLPPTKALVTTPSPFVSINITTTDSFWLPPPTEVLVSPLQRTLHTADLVFPHHCNIRVRDELRERLTGRPADNRMASYLAQKKFSRFSFAHLRMNSFFSVKSTLRPLPMLPFKKGGSEMKSENADCDGSDCDGSDCDGSDCDDDERKDESTLPVPTKPQPHPLLHDFKILSPLQESCFNADQVQEDEVKLRQRTMKLFELLARSQHDSVAIVTHKGFLRALEQGAFGQPHATEFKNCELRVYRFKMSRGSKILDQVQRLR